MHRLYFDTYPLILPQTIKSARGPDNVLTLVIILERVTAAARHGAGQVPERIKEYQYVLVGVIAASEDYGRLNRHIHPIDVYSKRSMQ